MAHVKDAEARGLPSAVKFSAEVDRFGRPRVGVYSVIDMEEHKDDGEFLVDRCEELYQKCLKLDAEGKLDDLHLVVGAHRANGNGAIQNGNGVAHDENGAAHHGNGNGNGAVHNGNGVARKQNGGVQNGNGVHH